MTWKQGFSKYAKGIKKAHHRTATKRDRRECSRSCFPTTSDGCSPPNSALRLGADGRPHRDGAAKRGGHHDHDGPFRRPARDPGSALCPSWTWPPTSVASSWASVRAVDSGAFRVEERQEGTQRRGFLVGPEIELTRVTPDNCTEAGLVGKVEHVWLVMVGEEKISVGLNRETLRDTQSKDSKFLLDVFFPGVFGRSPYFNAQFFITECRQVISEGSRALHKHLIYQPKAGFLRPEVFNLYSLDLSHPSKPLAQFPHGAEDARVCQEYF